MTGKTKILVIAGCVVGTIAVGFLIYKVVEAVKEVKEEARLEAEQKALEVDSEDYGDDEDVDSPESLIQAPVSDIDARIDQLVAEGRKDWERRMEKLKEKRAEARRSADISILDATDAVYSGEMDDAESFYAHEERMNELYPDAGDMVWETADDLEYGYEDEMGVPAEVLSDEPEAFIFDIEEGEERGELTPEESEIYRESGYVKEHTNYEKMSDEELLYGDVSTDDVYRPWIKNDPDSPEGWREIKDLFMENVYDMDNRVMLDKLFSYEWKKPLPIHKDDTETWWILKRNITMRLGNTAKYAQTVSIGQLIIHYATAMTMQMERIANEQDIKSIDDYVSHLLGQIGLRTWPDNVFEVDLIVAKLIGHTLDPFDNNEREWGMFGIDLVGEDLSAYEFGMSFGDQFKAFLEQYGEGMTMY